MPRVVGVTFRKVGKIYYFDPGDFELVEGSFIVAETARGMEFGEVALEPKDVPETELVAPLKPIVRQATAEDLEKEASNKEREKEALEVCEQKIREHNLPMKLIDAEISFDSSLITFSFSADGRIDFRDLVKDVATALKVRIQLHQIGVRDEARLMGGYGTCGRSLCCATFLTNFEPVSMKMAKEQSLFLNPAKFSGVCGKLMCCLKYEYDVYKDAHVKLPSIGALLDTEHGRVRVIDVNVISGELTVETEESVQLHLPSQRINLEGLCRRHGNACQLNEKGCFKLHSNGDYLPEADEEEDDYITEEMKNLVDEYNIPSPIVVPEVKTEELPSITNVTFRDPKTIAPKTERQSNDRKDNSQHKQYNHNGKNKPKQIGHKRPKKPLHKNMKNVKNYDEED